MGENEWLYEEKDKCSEKQNKFEAALHIHFVTFIYDYLISFFYLISWNKILFYQIILC